MVLIEMRDVSKAFLANKRKAQAQVVLEHANLSIEEGEFVSLIGPSGCGKTVSLSMMAGFLAPTQGEVLFRGSPIEAPGPKRYARTRPQLGRKARRSAFSRGIGAGRARG